MRKISASFFSERDFTAVDLEIAKLRDQAKEEKSRIEQATTFNRSASQDRLNRPDIGNDNQKPQTVVANVVKIDQKKPKVAEPEIESQFDDFLFPVTEEPKPTFVENRPHASRSYENESRSIWKDDLTLTMYQIVMGFISLLGLTGYFLTSASWLGTSAAGLTYLAIAPRFSARSLVSDCAIAMVLIASIAGLSAANLTIVAAIATLINRASSYFIAKG